MLACFTFALIAPGLHPLPELCQYLGIQLVCLGQQPTRSGKLPHPRRVHHCHRQTCPEQCLHHSPLVPTRGFHHDEFGLQIFHLFHQPGNSFSRVLRLCFLPFPKHCHI